MDDKTWNPFLKPKVNMEDFDPVVCPECNNSIFDQFYKVFRISSLNSPTGKTQVFNVPTFVCASCQHILDVKEIENPTGEKKSAKEKE